MRGVAVGAGVCAGVGFGVGVGVAVGVGRTDSFDCRYMLERDSLDRCLAM